MKADKANDIKMGGEGGGELRHRRPAGGGTELRSVEGVPARSVCPGATRGRRDAVGGTLSTAARPAHGGAGGPTTGLIACDDAE